MVEKDEKKILEDKWTKNHKKIIKDLYVSIFGLIKKKSVGYAYGVKHNKKFLKYLGINDMSSIVEFIKAYEK